MREDELEKNLQPFLAYLAQTPVNELLNDYTYQLVFIRSIWRMCGLIKAEFCNCCHQTLRIVPTFSPVTH